MGISKIGAVLFAAAAMATPSLANAACWSSAAARAAAVRDLQSGLMVAALRCGKSGADVLPAYNRFVETHRATLQAANLLLRNQFGAGRATRAGEVEYDRFATALANKYGAGSGGLSECPALQAMASQAANAVNSFDALYATAMQLGFDPKLPEAVCGTEYASNMMKK
ncbi:MAG: hypothetical protein U5J78_00810 [Parasphingorhabdus sp.]|nr:hypothetical protein [Parasphingorhabdus sp.]